MIEHCCLLHDRLWIHWWTMSLHWIPKWLQVIQILVCTFLFRKIKYGLLLLFFILSILYIIILFLERFFFPQIFWLRKVQIALFLYYLGGGEVINSAEESTSMNAAAAHKEHQERMLACLSTLSLFSKAKPDLMVKHAETLQPYLSMNMNGPAEQQVMNQVQLVYNNTV